jgi:O-antigen ligase
MIVDEETMLSRSSVLIKPTNRHEPYLLAILLVVGVLDAAFFPLATDNGIRLGPVRVIDLLGIAALIKGMFSRSWRKLTPGSLWTLVVLTSIWTAGTIVALIPHESVASPVVANLRIGNAWRLIVFLFAFSLMLAPRGGSQLALTHRFLSRVITWAAMVGAAAAFIVVREIGPDLMAFLALALALSLLQRTGSGFTRVVLLIEFIVGTMLCAQRATTLFILPAVVLAWLLTRRRQRRIGATKLALALIVFAMSVLMLLLTGLERKGEALAERFWVQTFGGVGNYEAVQSRIFQWHRAMAIIEEAPWLGHGLGAQYVTYEYGIGGYAMTGITHNVAFDMLIAFGVPLGLVVVGFLLYGTLRGLWPAHDVTVRVSAAIGMGLLAKGLVESILDKPRLELMLAFLMAVVLMSNKHLYRDRGTLQGDEDGELLQAHRYRRSSVLQPDAFRPPSSWASPEPVHDPKTSTGPRSPAPPPPARSTTRAP